jgi:hypothetical protein
MNTIIYYHNQCNIITQLKHIKNMILWIYSAFDRWRKPYTESYGLECAFYKFLQEHCNNADVSKQSRTINSLVSFARGFKFELTCFATVRQHW